MTKYEFAKLLKENGYTVQFRSDNTHNESIWVEINGKFLNIDTDDTKYDSVLESIKQLEASEENGARLSTWGGYRPGSGRKKELPDDARVRSITVTDDEYQKIKDYLKSLRVAD